MTKQKQVTIKMDARTAAVVRQVLFDAQKGYTYNEAILMIILALF